MKYLIEAVELLKCGEVVSVRTDTVYGLLADATIDTAVQNVYELKQRPKAKALIVLVDSVKMAQDVAKFTNEAMNYAKQMWLEEKKPVTLVLEANNISKIVTGGGSSVAVRLPNNAFCLELIHQLGHPIVAPSANISGYPTAISADMVKSSFGTKLSLIIDAGICTNVPSTIVSFINSRKAVLRK